MNLTNPSNIANLCEEFGFKFKKKFGQNFLINPQIPKKIAASSLPDATDTPRACIEIGPGAGTLTRELSELYDKVVAFEIDKDLIPVLEKTLADCKNTSVINEDILKVDLKSFIEENFQGYSVCVCANLPYYITTPIVMQLLETGANIQKIVVMMQKEVAQRLVASPATSDWGAITPTVKYYARVKRLFDVSPGNFMPRPDVVSTVVSFEPYTIKPIIPKSEEFLHKTIRGAFALRRKTLQNSLACEFSSLSKEQLADCIKKAELQAGVRGETLNLQQLVTLSDVLYDTIKGI